MINPKNYHFILIIALFSWALPALSQKQGNVDPKNKTTNKSNKNTEQEGVLDKTQIEEYKQKVRSMISFLEFALNTIGSDSTLASDKDVIINRSYLKFFADSKVQIEDDLDESRKTATYKNVQSYLQDLDYFFKDAKFELSVDVITANVSNEKRPYFVAEVTRYMKAISVNGDSIRNSKKRFIEVNLDVKNQDLKIASIYTTRYNENEALMEWWSGLSDEWKRIFSGVMNTRDSLQVSHIKRLLVTDSLDLSKFPSLSSLEPLNKFLQLKYLNIKSTRVVDLTPIRNLIHLESLNASFTAVTSLVPLKFTTELKELCINNTNIIDLTPIVVFKNLSKLDFHSTPIRNIDALRTLSNLEVLNASSTPLLNVHSVKNLKNLKLLNISNSAIEVLDSIAGTENLVELDISFSKVKDLTPLQNLKKLSVININNTSVQTLDPLKGMSSISKVYCDNTQIAKEDALKFMGLKPEVLVIYQSVGLFEWWKNLDPIWQGIFRKYVSVHSTPTVEEMATIANLVEIDISGITEIISLAPLKPLSNLRVLYANNTSIQSIYDLESLINLEILEVSSTAIRDISPLHNFDNLKRLNVDHTPIKQEQLDALVRVIPQCLVIYKTKALLGWWERLPTEWRDIFQKSQGIKELPPSTEELHILVQSDSFKIENNSKISVLQPMTEFITLKKLKVSNCRVENLDVFGNMMQIKDLTLSGNPIKKIDQLSLLRDLKSLDLSNTGITDIEVLRYHPYLEHLKISGTPVKNIKTLAKLHGLASLDISSTLVNSLKPVSKLTGLQNLKCYNSKISKKQVEKFRKNHPECEVLYY